LCLSFAYRRRIVHDVISKSLLAHAVWAREANSISLDQVGEKGCGTEEDGRDIETK